MAHGDYNCCMICDCKMEYGGFDSSAKERPCTDCVDELLGRGEPVLTKPRLLKRLKGLSSRDALQFLHEIGYEPCYYDNSIDKYLKKRKLVTTAAPDGKWGKRLRRLPRSEADHE